jgi:pimeloyl-ACP methyl ester carboxylesterase
VRALTVSAAVAAVAAAGATVAAQRRHARSIWTDPDYVRLDAPLSGEALEIVSRDGTRLHGQVFGPPDGATIVLAHGWTERLSFWSPVIRILRREGLRAVAYDLRGHGRSGRAVDDDYSMARFGEDVEAVLSAAAADGRRSIVAGHSLGAMAIAAWAQDHPVSDRVSAAALINTGLGDLATGHLLLGEAAKRLNRPASRMLGSRAPVPGFSSPVAHAAIRRAAFGPTATIGHVAFYERMLIDCRPDVRAACGIAMSDMDLWDAVARLTVPTLVVAGDGDRLTPPAHARRIAASLPVAAGLIELERTGHMSPLERPEAVARAIQGLVAQPSSLIGSAS